jgi:hypothetical protein
MTRDELLAHHRVLSDKARELMANKNHDYASTADPFRNFRRHGLQGILVRLSDKLARLESFVENGTLHVKDETILDTLLDIQNYSILFYGYYEDTKQKDEALLQVRETAKAKELPAKCS